jgi:hypothetical protein
MRPQYKIIERGRAKEYAVETYRRCQGSISEYNLTARSVVVTYMYPRCSIVGYILTKKNAVETYT